MKMRKQNRAMVCAAAAVAAAAMTGRNVSALEFQWKGDNGTNKIIDTNYTLDGVDTRAFTGGASGDYVNLGFNSTITSSVNTNTPRGVRVGHNFNTFTNADGTTGGPSTLTGPASLTVTAGTLTMGGGTTTPGVYPGTYAALVVGYNANGTYTNQAGETRTDQVLIVGADNPDDAFTGTGTGTLNVAGGTLRARRGDMIIGYGNPGVVNFGPGGNMNVLHNNPASSAANDGNYDLYVGYTTASTLNRLGNGTMLINNSFFIGSGSTVNLSNGVTTTRAKRVLTPGGTNTGFLTDAPDGHLVVGRNGSANDTLNINNNGNFGALGLTSVNVGGRFLMASGGAGATNSTVNHSEGNVTVALDFVVSDTGNASSATYNLSPTTRLGGEPSIFTANSGLSRIGRRGDGKFIQTAGIATFNDGLAVGDDDSTAPGETDNATGLYEISAGELHVTRAGNALSVGSAGNGTLRVIGQGVVVDVNGDMLVGNTSDGVGTLAYRFEPSEALSVVDVSGTAAFAKGSGLSLDTSLDTPAQRFHDVLTATAVVDSGLVDSPGWAHAILTGGTNGKLLQVGKIEARYWDTNGSTAGAGGPAPTGNWDGTTSNFNVDATGNSPTLAVTTYADDVSFGGIADATGTYTVTVSGTQSAHAVQVAQGNVTLTGGTIAAPIFDVAPGATATVSSNLAGGPAGSVTKTGAGTMTLTSAGTYNGGTTVAAGTLVLANADATAGGTISVADGALAQAQAGLPKAVTVTTLNTNTSGKFDLTNNSMVVKGMTAADVGALVKAGYAGGAWTGPGMNSSTAAAATNTGIGYADNAVLALTSFKGVNVGPTDVLVKYTYYGDADLDGDVDGNDVGAWAVNFTGSGGSTTKAWVEGDWDYDGDVDGNDVGRWAVNFTGSGGGTLSIPNAQPEAVAMLEAMGFTVVPEPASLSLLALGGVGLLARRARRTNAR